MHWCHALKTFTIHSDVQMRPFASLDLARCRMVSNKNFVEPFSTQNMQIVIHYITTFKKNPGFGSKLLNDL